MADDHYQIVAILVKYALRQPLNEEEKCLLEEWRSRSDEHAALPELLRDRRWLGEQRRQLHEPPTAEMWADIKEYIDETGEPAPEIVLPLKNQGRYQWLAAAVILGLLIVSLLRWERASEVRQEVRDFAPAVASRHYSALLMRQDGSIVSLDSLAKGAVVSRDGNLQLRKADSNSYVFEYLARRLPGVVPRQRLTIAPGSGTYQLQWPDGSRVWINSGSAITYPVDGRSALWELDGEAWFQLAHDPRRPVTIRMPDGAVTRVLGTSLDIRTASGKRDNRVVLFHGAARVVKGVDSLLLKPGSQVETGSKGFSIRSDIDSNVVLRWLRPKVKEPANFDFEDMDMLSLLPELASWYRVRVFNPGHLPGVAVTAGYPRDWSLDKIIGNLGHIEQGHVRLQLTGDTIFVLQLKPGG